MRKAFFMLVAVLMVFSANSSFAVTKNLIDFNQYEQKLASDPAFANSGDNNSGQPAGNTAAQPAANGQAQQGNGQAANADNSSQEKILKVSADDMKLEHWVVQLNSSSRGINNIRYSYAQAVKTKGLVGSPRTVLGARINFPRWAYIASAEISPPYEFPAYSDAGAPASVENGLIDNTGDIYTITTEVYGRNFDYSLYVQMKDEMGRTEKYYMGQLFFNGWRKLTWKNPTYIENVDLRNIKRLPIFPDTGLPYKKLDSFLVVKNQYAPGGNYLFYVANVSVSYDLAIVTEDEDIDQEGTWHILSDTMNALVSKNNKERSDLVSLKRDEAKKMAISRGETAANNGGNAQAAPANNNAAAPAAAQPAPAAAPAA